MANDIRVRIIGDDSSLHKALGHATSGTSKFGRALGVGLKGAAVVAGTALAGLGVAAKIGFDEFQQAQKVTAQTNAVLKSTGKAAHVTTKQVKDLAGQLLNLSGVDDEVIQSGENMLLTFKNIRNESGKGNKIFDQATKAVLDMDTAMTHGNSTMESIKGTSILVGKALNDPIAGLGRLKRVGVDFTDAQVDMIKKMVESGDVMGAQKLILEELNSEFGGSAKALGDTMPGQINKFKESFKNAMGVAMESLAPFLGQLAAWATKHMPEIQRVTTAVFTAIATVIETVAGFISTHWQTITAIFEGFKTTISAVVEFAKQHWPEFSAAVTTAFNAVRDKINEAIAFYNTDVAPAIQTVITAIKGYWDVFGADIVRIVGDAFTVVKTNIEMVLGVIKGIIKFWLAVFRGDWSGAWNAAKSVVSSVLTGIVGVIRGLFQTFADVAKSLGGKVKDGIVAGLKGIAGEVTDVLGDVKDAIFGLIGAAYGWGKSLAQAVKDGFMSVIHGIVREAQNLLNAVLPGNPVGGHRGERSALPLGGALDGSKLSLSGAGGGLTINMPVYLDGQLIYEDQKNIAAADLRRNLGV